MKPRLKQVWMVVLVLGIAGQTGFLLRDFILPWGWRVKQVWDQPRITRSADMSLGGQSARLIEFVRRVTPEDAVLLLPPEGEPGRFSLARSMQYFFFPRQLIECGAPETDPCTRALASPDTYILATTDFPAPGAVDGKPFLASPPTGMEWFKGLYGPGFVDRPEEGFDLRHALGAGLTDLGLIFGLYLLGAFLVLAIARRFTILELLCLSLPVGAGVLTWALFLISWIGIRLNSASNAFVYLVLLITSAFVVLRHREFLGASLGRSARGPGPIFIFRRVLILSFAAGLLGLSMALSIGTSYRLYDPVQIWSVKGYGLSQEGTILAAANWGAHGLAYPLNVPLQISLFHTVDADYLPGSKLLYPLLGLSLCLATYTFLRRQKVEEGMAALASLFLGSVPIVFFHSTDGFANLPFTFYLVAGILWSLEGIQSQSTRLQALAGVLLGLAAWTRPEGILYCLGILAVLWVGRLAVRHGRFAPAALSIPMAVIAGAWFVFTLTGGYMHGSNLDEGMSVFVAQVLAGRIDLTAMWIIIRVFARGTIFPFQAMFPAISATAWGAFFPVVLISLALGLRSFHLKYNPKGFMLFLQLLWVAGINLAIFYVRSYSRPGYEDFIERSFPRAFLPTAVLMLILAAWAFDILVQRRPNVDTVGGIAGE